MGNGESGNHFDDVDECRGLSGCCQCPGGMASVIATEDDGYDQRAQKQNMIQTYPDVPDAFCQKCPQVGQHPGGTAGRQAVARFSRGKQTNMGPAIACQIENAKA